MLTVSAGGGAQDHLSEGVGGAAKSAFLYVSSRRSSTGAISLIAYSIVAEASLGFLRGWYWQPRALALLRAVLYYEGPLSALRSLDDAKLVDPEADLDEPLLP